MGKCSVMLYIQYLLKHFLFKHTICTTLQKLLFYLNRFEFVKSFYSKPSRLPDNHSKQQVVSSLSLNCLDMMAMYKRIAFVLEETYESRFDNIPTTFGHYFIP